MNLALPLSCACLERSWLFTLQTQWSYHLGSLRLPAVWFVVDNSDVSITQCTILNLNISSFNLFSYTFTQLHKRFDVNPLWTGVLHRCAALKPRGSGQDAGVASPNFSGSFRLSPDCDPGPGFSFGFRDATLEGKMHCKIGPENVLHFLCKYSAMYCIQYRY